MIETVAQCFAVSKSGDPIAGGWNFEHQTGIDRQAMALRVHFDGDAVMGEATVRRADATKDLATPFEITRRSDNDLSYLISYGGLDLGASRSAVVAEIEIDSLGGSVAISVDPRLTMLGDQAGLMSATVGNGKLEVSGTVSRSVPPRPNTPEKDAN